MIDIKKLMDNGIFLTRHSKEKMCSERITLDQIKEILENGKGRFDNSNSNNEVCAWNHKPHISLTFNNLTVICCESLEHGILILSAYHGLPHRIDTNPFSTKRRC